MIDAGLSGKVVLVMGANHGIGAATARADATPELYEWCESHQVGYLIGIAGNRVLHEKSQRWQKEAQALAAASPTKGAKR